MRNVWIGAVVIAIAAGIGFFAVSNRSSNTQTTAPEDQVAKTIPATSTPSAVPAQEQNMIELTTSGFSPSSLTIKAGDKVTWINKSGTDAIVNSSPHPQHTDYPPLNLGTFPDGGTLSLTFDKPGTYKYHNHLNTRQFGTIIVQ